MQMQTLCTSAIVNMIVMQHSAVTVVSCISEVRNFILYFTEGYYYKVALLRQMPLVHTANV